MNAYERMRRLGIVPPPPPSPMPAFVPFVLAGSLIFLSGHFAKRKGAPWTGQIGSDLDTAEGDLAARSVAVDLVYTLHEATGDLNRIARIVKIAGYVNSAPDFLEHQVVINGASEILEEILACKGPHTCSTFGVQQLPMGACVEIELVAELI
ncbi:RidA family protein [Variovorax paradoxus]|uniref:RidA family protein n=1 Tax=Variovorax paradoxus TaxID=34073 RepID=UPI0019329F01|nr:RidA family protein [Variovorax paradoxus]